MAITDMSLPELSLPTTASARYTRPLTLRLSGTECQFPDQWNVAAVSVCSIGSEAYLIMQQSRAGQVLAVFRRSVYVQCDHGILCIGSASLGKGPLHVLLTSNREDIFRGVECGQSVSFGESVVLHSERNNAKLSVPVSEKIYSGKVVVSALFQFSHRHTLILQECGAANSAEHGFGWLLKHQSWQTGRGFSECPLDGLDAIDRGLRQQSYPSLQALFSWLVDFLESTAADVPVRTNNDNPLSVVHKLLGAGSGLTPAGDDLLAGVMLALHNIDRADMADVLWNTLQPWLTQQTNVISIAHLQLAARGQCSESMWLLLDQFLYGIERSSADEVQNIIRSVQQLANDMGASSGWDTLAGVSLVVRASVMISSP